MHLVDPHAVLRGVRVGGHLVDVHADGAVKPRSSSTGSTST
jgi:hypothetical protein